MSFALFENAFRAARRPVARRATGRAGHLRRALRPDRGGESLRLVPGRQGRRDPDDGDAVQSHGGVSLSEVPQRDHGGQPGRRAARRQRGRRTPARAAGGSLGVAVGRRRRRRAVVPLRSRDLPRPARDAAGRRRRCWRTSSSTVERIRHLDLYGCFPIAPRLSAAMLGLDPGDVAPAHRDRRPALVRRSGQRLRDARDRRGGWSGCVPIATAFGLVHALGWNFTKHALAVYAGRPPARGWQRVGQRGAPAARRRAGAPGGRDPSRPAAARWRPTPWSTAATARRSAASRSGCSRTGGGSSRPCRVIARCWRRSSATSRWAVADGPHRRRALDLRSGLRTRPTPGPTRAAPARGCGARRRHGSARAVPPRRPRHPRARRASAPR